jgi:hypothetical protein
MIRLVHVAAAVATGLALALQAGCGGGAGTAPVEATAQADGAATGSGTRGALASVGAASTIRAATLLAFMTDSPQRNGPWPPGGTVPCDVAIRRIVYWTVAPDGSMLQASAGLLVPAGTADACTHGTFPLVSFQHGTSDTAAFDGSDPTAALPLTTAAYFASHGYVTVIPDYLGYGAAASLGYHPYVVAESEAATVIDAVRAARAFFATPDAGSQTLSGQLFLAGTSEGGYVTMATQRAMERDSGHEFPLAAVVPISGPYDLPDETLDDVRSADAAGVSTTGHATFLFTAYNRVYGNIYGVPSDIFRAPWASGVEGLFPGAYGSDDAAIAACMIPRWLGKPTPADKVPAACAAKTGDPTQPLFDAAFLQDYLDDTPGTRGSQARADVALNTLLPIPRWHNVAPMTPCYGAPDATAASNARAAAQYFDIAVEDVQDDPQAPAFIESWAAAAAARLPDYHGQVEAPACTAWARYAVFDRYWPGHL